MFVKCSPEGFKSLIGRLLFIFSALLSIYGLETYRHNVMNNILRHYSYKLAKQETQFTNRRHALQLSIKVEIETAKRIGKIVTNADRNTRATHFNKTID